MGDVRVAGVNNGVLSFYHTNHLGSTNLITDGGGVLKELLEYKPFGEFAKNEKYGTPEQRAWHQFTGQRLDEETGLYYYGARYYDPVVARFLTPDIIVQNPFNPQTFNRYSYTGNNPVNNIDPSGHSFLKFIKKFFGVAGGFVNAIITGEWAEFGKEAAIAVISIAANVLLPGSGTLASNFFVNVGLHVLRGAAIGAITGGIASEIMGGSFSDGAKIGGMVGAASGFLQGVATSEQFQNWQGGNGFRSNADVAEDLAGKINSGEVAWDDVASSANNVNTSAESKSVLIDALVDGDPMNGAAISTWDEALLGPTRVLSAGSFAIKSTANGLKNFSIRLGEAGFARVGAGKSVFQLNRLIQQSSNVPSTIARFDGGKEMLHVHFSDKTALYANGAWKHGVRELTNKEKAFLINEAGFNLK